MRTAYQYRLRLTSTQQATIDRWLELCRRQYNHRLAERFNWYEQNRCDVNSCPIICHLPELKERPGFYSQKRDLVNSKRLFPDYKDIPSHTLQDVVKRVEKTFERWLKGDCNGKRSGKPRFKGVGRYRSLGFPDPIKSEHIQGRLVQIPKLGKLKLILHRPIPDGFDIKTAAITKKADGYYITLSLQDSSVPDLGSELPTVENTIGIDMGLKSFLTDSEGTEVAIPQHYRKTEKRLKRLQRSLSRKKKGSNNRRKAVRRVAKQHLKVANQRKDFHCKTAKKLLSKGKNVGHESLNIKGLAKSRLAKSVNDAGWGQFLQILSVKAANAGLMTIAVNPNGTSQDCSNCGVKVPKTLADRWHSCPSCGCSLDRDHNAAINIRNLAVGHSVNKASGVRCNSRTVKEEARAVCVASASGVCHEGHKSFRRIFYAANKSKETKWVYEWLWHQRDLLSDSLRSALNCMIIRDHAIFLLKQEDLSEEFKETNHLELTAKFGYDLAYKINKGEIKKSPSEDQNRQIALASLSLLLNRIEKGKEFPLSLIEQDWWTKYLNPDNPDIFRVVQHVFDEVEKNSLKKDFKSLLLFVRINFREVFYIVFSEGKPCHQKYCN